MEVAGANRRWRWQFRYRGSRRESAVAQLFSLGSMDTPTSIQTPMRHFMALVWILASVIIALAGLLFIAYTLHGFYLDTATLAPGTGVRPMGVAAAIGVAWIGSILFGGACALIGGIVSLVQRRRLLVVFAILAAIFTWVPMFFSNWGFAHVVELRKLVLEP